jgi:hypothetical protein
MQAHIEPNPFALMMNPEAVLQAVEASTRLGGLNRRVYRPLDRPTLVRKGGASDAAGSFDAALDADDSAE